MNENLKAWLGLNLQDTLINISTLPFLAVFFVNDLLLAILLFLTAFLLSLSGLIVYFVRKNNKISKITLNFNKWSSVAIVLIMWSTMLIKIGFLIAAKISGSH